ncbi:MAG: ABC-F family ATP-binding cassette domain-containing protein [Pseudomonadota bacterium]
MLEIDNLTYRLGDRILFDGAKAVIQRRSKVGFVGRNGAGKTTLFKLIRGEASPETGEIRLPPRTRIGGVEQEVPAGPERLLDVVLAAHEERSALLGEAETATDPMRIAEIQTRLADIDAHSAEARAARILKGLGFSDKQQNQPCSDFSGGWRMRVALAGVLFSAPDLLLLDEPTNYLDLEGALWLETYLADYPSTAIIISHDRDLLNSAVTQTLHLEHQKLQLYGGAFDIFAKQRALQLAVESKARAKQSARAAHLQSFVDRFRAKATKAKQAQSRLKMLSKMEPLAQRSDEPIAGFQFEGPLKVKAPPLINGVKAAVGYEPEKPVLKDMTFRIDPDDRIALLGQNGNGKSTFAKLLSGRLKRQDGKLHHPAKMRVAYFTQHQLDELNPKLSPLAALREKLPELAEAKLRARVAAMGFDRNRMDTPTANLSGGEKARLLLGLITIGGSDLLILDEPTNHLDIESRQALVEALTEYEGALIIISHDRHLIEATADRLWLIERGTLTPYENDLESYRKAVLGGPADDRKRKPKKKAKPARTEASSPPEGARPNPATVRVRLAEAEDQLEKINVELAKIDRALAAPGLFSTDPDKAAKLSKRRAKGAEAQERWEARWLELTELLDQVDGGQAA